ncbi:MAG TPA: recombination mediator RecR [Solidesulfovibrio magneticus]|nr:recombination mediator RecR [Solidesulfovibrio magneticus]
MASQTTLPVPLAELVDQLAKLPGLGPKSALKVAMTLLEWPRPRADGLGEAILRLRERLCLCVHCASLSETPVCPVCADPTRNGEQLCLVAQWDAIMQMEETGLYTGRYLVLGGLLDPLEGVSPGQLRLDVLRAKLAEGVVTECILALGATLAAETTASHIKNLLEREFPAVRLTRLAQGIPLGAEVKYVDKETLSQSLRYRQDL